MQWSKLKRRVEAFFSPVLDGRVELRATRYHGAPDKLGRGYITVDGNEVWNMCSFQFMMHEHHATESIADATGLPRFKAQRLAQQQLETDGVLAQWDFYRALESYCNEPFEDILASSNVLTRSLAMLDHRLGKRRLSSIERSAEHPMVQYFHALRCEAEKLHA